MSTPHDCPLPVNQSCPHVGTISSMQANMTTIMEFLKELRDDMKGIKKPIENIYLLEQGQGFHKEALERAFRKIEDINKSVEMHERLLQQFEGMKKLAIVLWTVLASGLGVVLLKLFT